MTAPLDLDAYLKKCLSLYRYLNQDTVWAPRPPRPPVQIADMDPEWRYNAAKFLMRQADILAFRYVFGMVRSASLPVYRDVIGEYDGEPIYSGRVFSDLDLMGECASDTFDDEADHITAEPERWLRKTALYRALTADLPQGHQRAELAARARHWSTCPIRTGTGAECRCQEIAAEQAADTTPEWTI
jgi:hypothetical protein